MAKTSIKKMKCTQGKCDSKLVWQSDFDFEDVGYEGDGIVSYWICPKCNSMHELVSDFELGEEYLQLQGEGA